MRLLCTFDHHYCERIELTLRRLILFRMTVSTFLPERVAEMKGIERYFVGTNLKMSLYILRRGREREIDRL